MCEVKIDRELDMAYVYVKGYPHEKAVSNTVSADCNIDYDDEGNIIGVGLFLPRETPKLNKLMSMEEYFESLPACGPHRGPEGPNEDVAQCFKCHSMTYTMRPWGETFGPHRPDCSLPIWHESYCQGGGDGHPEAPNQRG